MAKKPNIAAMPSQPLPLPRRRRPDPVSAKPMPPAAAPGGPEVAAKMGVAAEGEAGPQPPARVDDKAEKGRAKP